MACKGCAPEAPHDDYARPLDVRWLCKPCHETVHHGERAVVARHTGTAAGKPPSWITTSKRGHRAP